MNIKTERLLLRDWTTKDAPAWVEITKQKDIIKWIIGVKYNASLKEAKKLMKSDEEKNEAYYCAIIEKENGKTIGSIWLRNIDEEHERKIGELGILLKKEFWNKRYATEACKAIINFGFNKLRLIKIYAKVNEKNHASKKLIENLGFKREGKLRKEGKIRFQNTWHDEL